jgi:hypothetical protein
MVGYVAADLRAQLVVLGSEHVERAGERIGNLDSGVQRQYSGTAGRVETEAPVRGLPTAMLTLSG